MEIKGYSKLPRNSIFEESEYLNTEIDDDDRKIKTKDIKKNREKRLKKLSISKYVSESTAPKLIDDLFEGI